MNNRILIRQKDNKVWIKILKIDNSSQFRFVSYDGFILKSTCFDDWPRFSTIAIANTMFFLYGRLPSNRGKECEFTFCSVEEAKQAAERFKKAIREWRKSLEVS